HTRFSRDWSSDVCSSDLPPPAFSVPVVGAARRGGVQALLDQRANLVRILRIAVGTGGRVYGAGGGFWAVYVRLRAVGGLLCLNRSEERRAGQQCGSRWAQ